MNAWRRKTVFSSSLISRTRTTRYHIQQVASYHSTLYNCESFQDMLKKLQEEAKPDKKEVKEEAENGAHKEEEQTPKKEKKEHSIDMQETIGLLRYRLTDAYYNFVDNLKQAYAEMTGEEKETQLSRKVEQATSYRKPKVKKEGEDAAEEVDEEIYSGPNAIVHVKQPKNAWESMKARLSDSPLIQEILKNSRKFQKVAGETPIGQQAQRINESVQEKLNKAKEFWETSQNPLVYTVSGVFENLTGETEEGIAVAAIKKLDPNFNKEDWSEEILKTVVPSVLKAHIEGNSTALKQWLKEGVHNKLSAEIRLRKQDGIVFDPNILDIDENQIIIKHLENEGAVIVGIYTVQQIHCVRNRKGEIMEGNETDVRAKFYSIAFQLTYDEDDNMVVWKVVDYQFAGETPYY